jgi:small subunit ribosomal protein S6
MNNYEGLFIIRPDLKEEDIQGAIKAIGESVTKNGGSVKKEETWGKKQLAYPIRKFREGYYYKLDFEAPPAAIIKLESVYKLSDETILRTMITRR